MKLTKTLGVLVLGFLLTLNLVCSQEKKEETGDANSFYLKCIDMIKIKDADNAVKYGEQAVALDNTKADYHYQLGLAYALKIDQVEMMEKMTYANKMLEAWKKAVELDGKHLNARVALAGFYLNAPPFAGGSVDKAKEQAQEIMKIDPLMGYSIKAVIEVKENKLKEAGETAKKIFELHKAFKEKNPGKESSLEENALNQIGYAFLNAEKIDEAIEIFKMNIEAFPKNFNPYDSLAEAYMKKGDKKKAIEYYEKALELNPNKTDYEKKAFQNQQEYLKKLKEK